MQNHHQNEYRPNLVRKILPSLLLFVIATAVLPYGAVWPLPLSVATILICLVAIIATVVLGPPNGGRWLFNSILAVTLLLIVWSVIQAKMPVPMSLANPIWGYLSDVPADYNAKISLMPADSIFATMYFGLCGFVFLTTQMVASTDDRSRYVINYLMIGGGMLVIFGLLQFFMSPTYSLVLQKEAYLDSLTANFINRNSAGTFFGLVFLVCLRSTWSRVSVKQEAVTDSVSTSSLQEGKLSATAALTFLVLIALLLTKSRGAIFSTVIGSTTFCLLMLAGSATLMDRPRRMSRYFSRGRLLQVASIIVAAPVLIFAFGGQVLLRAEMQGGSDDRFCVWPSVINLIAHNSLVGSGAGTFRYAFTEYREPSCGLNFIWDRAHNLYLEGWATLGIVFTIAFGAILIPLAYAHILGLRNRVRGRSYSALGIASMTLVILHGFVDFSLQIPGVAVYLSCLLGATSAMSLRYGKRPA